VVIFSRQIASRGAYQSLFQRRDAQDVRGAGARLAERDFPFVTAAAWWTATRVLPHARRSGRANSETVIDVIERRGA
jgi:tRNA pseudouridine32 synthase/23S rRNA pseudouridine746 synthase